MVVVTGYARELLAWEKDGQLPLSMIDPAALEDAREYVRLATRQELLRRVCLYCVPALLVLGLIVFGYMSFDLWRHDPSALILPLVLLGVGVVLSYCVLAFARSRMRKQWPNPNRVTHAHVTVQGLQWCLRKSRYQDAVTQQWSREKFGAEAVKKLRELTGEITEIERNVASQFLGDFADLCCKKAQLRYCYNFFLSRGLVLPGGYGQFFEKQPTQLTESSGE